MAKIKHFTQSLKAKAKGKSKHAVALALMVVIMSSMMIADVHAASVPLAATPIGALSPTNIMDGLVSWWTGRSGTTPTEFSNSTPRKHAEI